MVLWLEKNGDMARNNEGEAGVFSQEVKKGGSPLLGCRV